MIWGDEKPWFLGVGVRVNVRVRNFCRWSKKTWNLRSGKCFYIYMERGSVGICVIC